MLNSLFSIVIDLWISTLLGPVNQKFIFCFEDEFSLFLSINQVECHDVTDFKCKRSVGYPLPVVDWAETVLIQNPVSCHQSVLIRFDGLTLIVSLWTSLSPSTVTMIISLFDVSLRSFSVYVAVSQN